MIRVEGSRFYRRAASKNALPYTNELPVQPATNVLYSATLQTGHAMPQQFVGKGCLVPRLNCCLLDSHQPCIVCRSLLLKAFFSIGVKPALGTGGCYT
eukprot:scaffold165374_cov14-Tisochrysis_lutea.AAC.1